MSKTKTSIVNADILNSKINTENYNNVYDISTPVFNKLNSIPNTCGKMTSYSKFTDDSIKWRKYIDDSSYIELMKNGNLRDSNGKYKSLTDTVQVTDTTLSGNFLDITRNYILREGGLYSSSGSLIYSNSNIKSKNKAKLFELSEGCWVIYYSSNSTIGVFWDGSSATTVTVQASTKVDIAYDTDNDWIFYTIGSTVYRLKADGTTDSSTISNRYAFCSGQFALINTPKVLMTTENKLPVLRFAPSNVDTTTGQDITASSSTTQRIATDMKLVWSNDTVSVQVTSSTWPVTSFTPATTPTYSYNKCDDDTYQLTCTNESGGLAYLYGKYPSNVKTTDYYQRFGMGGSDLVALVGFQTNSESMVSWREYGDWLIYTFDGKYIVTYKKNLVIPLGFADDIIEIKSNSLIYISSIDQNVHYLEMTTPTDEYYFDSTKSIDLLEYSSKLDLVSILDSSSSYRYFFSISYTKGYGTLTYISDWINNSSLKSAKLIISTPVIFGKNINYIKSNNDVTLATGSEYYYICYDDDTDISFYVATNFENIGELYFFATGSPSQEYATIPLVYQSESSLDLDLEVERDIPNRLPAPVGVEISRLTPVKWLFKYNDVGIEYVTIGGSVINAFDIDSDSFRTSDDYIDNIISLRGNLYTIKNSNIYGVSSDYKDLTYISSLGRMKYICNNDSLILFYDKVLKCLMSFDASNSWNVFLNTPLLDILDGAISNQNEIVLLTNKGILFSRNNTMTLVYPDDWSNYQLFSSDGIQVACGNILYSPGTTHRLTFETSWLGMTDCRRLFQLDTIYLEFEIESNSMLDFSASIDMLVDDEISAGDYSYTVETVGKLKYVRLQPTAQRCNAFKWSLLANASLKRVSYSVTTDEELQTVTAPALQEIKL